MNNFVLIDTVIVSEANAIMFLISETLKANNLIVHDNSENVLTEMPKHITHPLLMTCFQYLKSYRRNCFKIGYRKNRNVDYKAF